MEWEDGIELVGLGGLIGFFVYGCVNFSKKRERIEMMKETCVKQSSKYVSNCKAIVDSYDKSAHALLTGNFHPLSVTIFENSKVYEVMLNDHLFTKKIINTKTPCISIVGSF